MQVVAHNLLSQFTNRQLKISSGKRAKASEKLSSGYKINRSADDAAGLQISEKMRSQIRGAKRASANAQDGISLIQTAEGALNETHEILHRINELAIQAANDTNQEVDRQAIQEEINQLTAEIDKISDSTTFNNMHVLKAPQLVDIDTGNHSQATLDNLYNIKTPTGTQRSVYGAGMDFKNVNSSNINELIGKSFTTTCTENCDQIFTFKFTNSDTSSATLNGDDMTIEIGINSTDITNGTDIVNEIVNQVTQQQTNPPFNGYSNPNGDLLIGHANGISSQDSKLILYSLNDGPNYSDGMGLLKAGELYKEEGSLHFQIGGGTWQGMEYTIRSINTTTLKLNDLDVMSYETANETIEAVQNAVNAVSGYRSYLGSVQNRLEHSIAVNENTAENTQASESRIRDADMAQNVLEQAKYNILEQTAQAMLAQSNQSTQGVLSLLQ